MQPDILDRIIEPRRGGFSAEHARYVLSLDFSPDEQLRFGELSSKAQAGTLDPDEEAELNHFLEVSAMLTILQSKARVSLNRHNFAA